jgi:cytochrome c biogenesis protein CcdA
MILLLAFAFLAGAATAITPCVLPVLPALPSASGTGGRRRPIGIVTGLTLSDAGEDVREGAVTVRGQRLYRLVKLDSPGEHVLTLRLDPAVSGFAFTFG